MKTDTLTGAPGSRDEHWGPNKDGRIFIKDVFDDGQSDARQAQGALILDDGSTLIATTMMEAGLPHFSIAKLNALGELDERFGRKGFLTELFAPDLSAKAGEMVQGADGRIYMFGGSKAPDSLDTEMAVLCFDETGKRIEDFGTNGQIIIEKKVNDRVFHGHLPGRIRVLPDGSLLVVANGAIGPSRVTRGYLMKFDARGRPVTSFGNNGVVDINLPYEAVTTLKDVCVLSDGRILLAGYAHAKSSRFSGGLLSMLNQNGSTNLIFGGDPNTPGFRLFAKADSNVSLNAVTEREPGKYLAAGSIGGVGATDAIGLLLGFDNQGKNDPEFNAGVALEGAVSPSHTTGWDALFTHGPNIYAAGGYDLLLASLTPDGKLNPRFGTGGVVGEFMSGAANALLPYSSDRLLYVCNVIGLGGVSGVFYRYYRA
ncbi:hypothetical protein N8H74_13725 [Pseudomonas sp. B2M1-30]|uniref:hypothetical protein n=1 Tax=Pseudomonas TaxID=286 RepID=UPI0021C5BDA4|nr:MULTISPECIES: hypothetical protein [Pseudomonas]MCU0119318.1 hypothetical protein [Pseudomonas sp. B2M1-30]MCU7262132.1 hypothetical protein [Pseudomonas koreensis]